MLLNSKLYRETLQQALGLKVRKSFCQRYLAVFDVLTPCRCGGFLLGKFRWVFAVHG